MYKLQLIEYKPSRPNRKWAHSYLLNCKVKLNLKYDNGSLISMLDKTYEASRTEY